MTLEKKQSDSDFTKSSPSQPGKEFEIKKRLDKLRGIGRNNFNNNNNNNINPGGGGGGIDLDGLGPPPTVPNIEDLIENGPQFPPPPPQAGGQEVISNIFHPPPLPQPPSSNVINKPFVVPKIDGDGPIGNSIFGSIGAMMGPRSKEKTTSSSTTREIDDFLYELLDDNLPT